MAVRRTTLLLATLAIWSVAWVVWTADVLVEPVPFALERAARRLPLCLVGAGLCMALGAVLAQIPVHAVVCWRRRRSPGSPPAALSSPC